VHSRRGERRPDQPFVRIAARRAEMPDGWKTAIERHAGKPCFIVVPVAHLPDAGATTTPNPFRPKCRWLLVETSVEPGRLQRNAVDILPSFAGRRTARLIAARKVRCLMVAVSSIAAQQHI